MKEEIQNRKIRVGDDDITVYDVSHSNSLYTAAYQNRDTRALDEKFELTGEHVPKDSDIAHYLRLSTGPSSLGKTEVEQVLSYFAEVARQAGNFVGLPEEEIRENVRKGRLSSFKEGWIDKTLRYSDGMYEGVNYLKKIEVEDRDVLFPANLRKMLL